MADPKQLALIRQGPKTWNQWRQTDPAPRIPDLSETELSGADLSRANLSKADLSRADLSRADLRNANLSMVDLKRALQLLAFPYLSESSERPGAQP